MKTNWIKTLAVATALASTAAYASPAVNAGRYDLDAAHSKIGFEVAHLVISSVEGRFNKAEGEFTLSDKVQDSKIDVTIDASSIDTGIAKRDDHLKSEDFLNTSKYPTLTFKSKKITGSPTSMKIVGDLTMHGVTKEVTLDAKYLGAVKDAWGNTKAAFQAKTKINRKDFGLTWNKIVEAGPSVGDQVTIALNIQGTKKQ